MSLKGADWSVLLGDWELELRVLWPWGCGVGREMVDITSEHSSLGRDESELETEHTRNLARNFSLGGKEER